MSNGTERPPEHEESLWWLAVSPTIWTVHFLACYITAAIWCAKHPEGASLGPVRIAIAVLTAAALGGIALVGRHGWVRHQYGAATVPHDFDTPEDRHRFLGFATLLLSGLSFVGVLYVGAVALFLETCR